MRNIEKLTHKKLEEILLDANIIDRTSLEEKLRKSRATGDPLEDILIQSEQIDEETLAAMLAERLQIPYLSLKNYEINSELMSMIPKFRMAQHRFVPVDRYEESVLTIITSTVPTMEMLGDLNTIFDCELFIYIGTISDINNALNSYQPADEQAEAEQEAAVGATSAMEMSQELSGVGWESIFDIADDQVKNELKKKATDVGLMGETGALSGSIEDQLSSVFGEDPAPSIAQTSIEDQISMAFGDEGEEQAPQEEYSEEEYEQEGHEQEEYEQEEYEEEEYDEEEEIISASENSSEDIMEDEEAQMELQELETHLKKNPIDYDAVNQYVEIALDLGNVKAAVQQLLKFAFNLDQEGREDEAVNCYEYILELEPENRQAKKRLGK